MASKDKAGREAKKPKAANPRRVNIDELFHVPPHAVMRWPKTANQVGFWGAFFVGLDKVLHVIEPFFPKKSRESAIQKAVAFLQERLNGEDGVGEADQSSGGEDFGWYTEEIPGIYLRLGVWDGDSDETDLHHPAFMLD